jgi:hypothetical protein
MPGFSKPANRAHTVTADPLVRTSATGVPGRPMRLETQAGRPGVRPTARFRAAYAGFLLDPDIFIPQLRLVLDEFRH